MIIYAASLLIILSWLAAPQVAKDHAHQPDASDVFRAADQARIDHRNNDAIRLYRQGLQLKPTWSEGIWYLSTLLYEEEQFAEARDLLRRFVSQTSDVGPGWALLGLSEFKTREYTRSLEHLQRAKTLGLAGRQAMAQSVSYFIAALLTRLEQYDDSLSVLHEIVNSGRCDTPLVEAAGLAALRLPLLPAEIPGDRHEMIRLAGTGVCAVERGRREDAENSFSRMVTEYPDEPGVHFLYGTFLLDVRPEDGIRELKCELEISPSHIPARLRLADVSLKQEQVDTALQLAQEAVKLEPKHAPAHMVLGEVLIAKKDLAGGIRELEAAREMAPQTVRTRYALLRAYAAAGRKQEADRERDAIEQLKRREHVQ